MDKSKIKATVIVLVILVSAAVIAAIATGRTFSKNNSGETSGNLPSETEDKLNEDVAPTPTPEIAESPIPTEEPSPMPENEPQSDRTVSGSGSFSSNTGTAMNLVVNYSATAAGNNDIQVTFEFYLTCYSINATAKPGGASIKVNGNTFTANTPEINVQSDTVTSVKLCSQTVTLPLEEGASLNIPVTASWAFGGTYSDVDLDVIEAVGTLTING